MSTADATTDPLRAAAVDLAAAVRGGDLDPLDLVDRHIARIEAVNPLINALVADRFELARGEARAARERLASAAPAELPPFLGVPCTIKEFFHLRGMPRSGGVLRNRDLRADRDAPTVARLRAAGFIPLGVSNVPEGGLWMETTNLVYGRTNNPWDLRRTPGGSSGGEGALVAAGCSPVGLGSDIGGSIRIPAAMCGTFGHKPSGGLVPNTDQFPDRLGGISRYLSSGPLTRSARDLAPLLAVLAGPDGRDPACVPMALRDPAQVDLRGLVVYPVEHSGRARADAAMRRGLERATAALVERGAEVRALHLDGLRRSVEIWSAMLEEASEAAYAEILGGDRPVRVLPALLRHLVGRPTTSGDALAVLLGEAVMGLVPGLSRRFVDEGHRLRAALDEALGERGVLLHPPYSRPAPLHRGPWTTPFDFGFTALFNVMQSAVTVAPVGQSDLGLPVAVQVIARQGRDELPIATALALEEALGGWQCAEPRPLPRSETWGPVQARRKLHGKEPFLAP